MLYGVPVCAAGNEVVKIDSLLAVTKPTAADAVDAGFATLVAVIVAEEAPLAAVNNPLLEIEPPTADHVTPTLLVPATRAVNCTVPEVEMRALAGEMLTAMAGVGVVFCVPELAPKIDEQEETQSVTDSTRAA